MGKTTLSRVVTAMMQKAGIEALLVEEFPDNFLAGYLQALLRRDPYLRLHDTHNTVLAQTLLLISAHAYKYETLIRPALRRGCIVVVDRYIDSVFAYQLPLLLYNGYGEEDAADWLTECSRMLPPPDMTVYVEVGAEQARERRRLRGDNSDAEDPKFLNDVAAAYKKRFTTRKEGLVRLSNNGSPHDAATPILEIVCNLPPPTHVTST